MLLRNMKKTFFYYRSLSWLCLDASISNRNFRWDNFTTFHKTAIINLKHTYVRLPIIRPQKLLMMGDGMCQCVHPNKSIIAAFLAFSLLSFLFRKSISHVLSGTNQTELNCYGTPWNPQLFYYITGRFRFVNRTSHCLHFVQHFHLKYETWSFV